MILSVVLACLPANAADSTHAHTHNWGNWKVVSKATCNQRGKEQDYIMTSEKFMKIYGKEITEDTPVPTSSQRIFAFNGIARYAYDRTLDKKVSIVVNVEP